MSVSGQTDGAGAGSVPGPTIQRLPVQTIRWQSAAAPREVCCKVTSISKSMQGTTKSGPTLPLIWPISGVATMASWLLPPPDSPAASKNSAMACTPDQLLVVGPPGMAQPVMTARAPARVPDCSAVWSIAASCAMAPSGVWLKPVGTCAAPALVAAGRVIGVPGSFVETGPGWESASSTVGIGLSANASRGSAAVPDGPAPPVPPPPAALVLMEPCPAVCLAG